MWRFFLSVDIFTWYNAMFFECMIQKGFPSKHSCKDIFLKPEDSSILALWLNGYKYIKDVLYIKA